MLEKNKEKLGDRIKKLLKEKGMTQTQLSETTGIYRTELNRTINNKRKPKLDELDKIAFAFGITTEELQNGIDIKINARAQEKVNQVQDLLERATKAEAEKELEASKAKMFESDLKETIKRAVKAENELHQAITERDRIYTEKDRKINEQKIEIEKIKQIFEIIKKKNESEKISFLEKERNLNITLKKWHERHAQSEQEKANLTSQLNSYALEVNSLKKQLEANKAQLRNEQSNKAVAALIAGVAGAMLGSSGRK